MKRHVKDYRLYRWRYSLGYIFGLISIVSLMLLAALYIPGGLREAEQASAITSSHLAFDNFQPSSVINLPYHLLQRASFGLLGVSALSIKLPSIFIGVFTVIGMFMMIRTWFRTNTAIIVTLVGATTPLFLFATQDGTPLIYAIAVSIWLLVVATFVSRRKSPTLTWKIIFFILLALNLYTPLGIYLNLAIVSTILFHPHIRHQARQLSLERLVLGSIAALIVLTPLIYSLSMKPELALPLLGIPPNIDSIGNNILLVLNQWFGFHSDQRSAILSPIFSIGTSLVIALGIWRFVQIKYTARSYITWLWALILLPLIMLNPEHAPLVFPIGLLMIAMGISSLFIQWYKLFPYNPYARVAGLLPMALILGGLMSSGAIRYATTYYYAIDTVKYFSPDSRLLVEAIEASGATEEKPVKLLPSSSQREFYQLIDKYEPRIELTDKPTPGQSLIVHHDRANYKTDAPLVRIVTDRRSNQADRFYVYGVEDVQ